MRSAVVGLSFVAVGLMWLAGANVWVAAQRPGNLGSTMAGERSSATSDTLVSHSVELADGRQQIAMVDPRTRTLAVYQIDPRTGAISLKSVRNLHWDLQMDEYNAGDKPSPKEIRAMLEHR